MIWVCSRWGWGWGDGVANHQERRPRVLCVGLGGPTNQNQDLLLVWCMIILSFFRESYHYSLLILFLLSFSILITTVKQSLLLVLCMYVSAPTQSVYDFPL